MWLCLCVAVSYKAANKLLEQGMLQVRMCVCVCVCVGGWVGVCERGVM